VAANTNLQNGLKIETRHEPGGNHPVPRLPRPARADTLAVLALLSAAFIVYSVFWRQAPLMLPDSPTYMSLARDIEHLHLSHLPSRTPGYPLLLLLTGSEEKPTRSLFYSSLALHLSAVAMLAYMLYYIGIARTAVLLFVGLSILPPYVEPSAYVMSETLCQFTLVLSFTSLLYWLFTQRLVFFWTFAGGATYTALVRPTYEILVPLLAICVLGCFYLGGTFWPSRRRILFCFGFALLLVAIALGGCTYLNYVRFGYLGTSSIDALTLSHKTVPVLEYLPSSFEPLRSLLIKYRDQLLVTPFDDHVALHYIHRTLPDARRLFGGDEVQAIKAIRQANIYLITHKPMSYLNECLKLLCPYWMPTDYPLANWQSGRLRIFWALTQALVILAFLLQATALAGLVLLYASTRIFSPAQTQTIDEEGIKLLCTHTLGTAVIVYTFLVSCFLGNGVTRYRAPTDLLIIAACIIGFAIWKRVMFRSVASNTLVGYK